jgi:hypothetical protein
VLLDVKPWDSFSGALCAYEYNINLHCEKCIAKFVIVVQVPLWIWVDFETNC